MNVCPNPQCHFLLRTGHVPVYQDHILTCADCGTRLVYETAQIVSQRVDRTVAYEVTVFPLVLLGSIALFSFVTFWLLPLILLFFLAIILAALNAIVFLLTRKWFGRRLIPTKVLTRQRISVICGWALALILLAPITSYGYAHYLSLQARNLVSDMNLPVTFQGDKLTIIDETFDTSLGILPRGALLNYAFSGDINELYRQLEVELSENAGWDFPYVGSNGLQASSLKDYRRAGCSGSIGRLSIRPYINKDRNCGQCQENTQRMNVEATFGVPPSCFKLSRKGNPVQ